jgi:hypothetical protein
MRPPLGQDIQQYTEEELAWYDSIADTPVGGRCAKCEHYHKAWQKDCLLSHYILKERAPIEGNCVACGKHLHGGLKYCSVTCCNKTRAKAVQRFAAGKGKQRHFEKENFLGVAESGWRKRRYLKAKETLDESLHHGETPRNPFRAVAKWWAEDTVQINLPEPPDDSGFHVPQTE